MTGLDGRTETGGHDVTSRLDDLFAGLARMPAFEGYKVGIIEGTIFMAPQPDTHWRTTFLLIRVLLGRFGDTVNLLSDVRIDFPGGLNGYAPDLVKVRDDAEKDADGRWRYEDVEFVAEVISKDTAANDYGPKKTAYATAEVPVYLIADPYQGKCHLYTQPKEGVYVSELSVAYGGAVDMSTTLLGLTLETEEFPRG